MIDVKQLLKNIFSNWAIYALSMAVSIFLTPFIINSLGRNYYGAWVLINSLVGYMNILDFGIRPAITRNISKYIGLGDYYAVRRVIASAGVILVAIGGAVFVVIIILAFSFHKIFNVENLDPYLIKWSILVVGFGFAVGLPLQVFGGLLGAFERYDLQNVNKLIFLIVRTFLIVFFLNRGQGILCLAVIISVTGIAQYLFDYRASLLIFEKISFSFSMFDRKILKDILTFGIYSFIIQISLQITYYIDVTVIGIFLTTSAVAVYSISSSLVEYSRQLVGNMTRVFTPIMTKSFYRKRIDEMADSYILATHYTCAISFPLVTGLALLGENFIILWVGQDFEMAYWLMLVLLIPQIVGLPQQMSSQVMFGFGRNDILAYLELASALINLILSLILVRSLGMVGVAVSTAIPLFVTHTFILPFIVCKRLHLSILKYFKSGYCKSFVNTAIMAVYIYFGKKSYPPDSWMSFSILVITAIILYCLTGFFIVLGEHSKHNLKIFLSKKRYDKI